MIECFEVFFSHCSLCCFQYLFFFLLVSVFFFVFLAWSFPQMSGNPWLLMIKDGGIKWCWMFWVCGSNSLTEFYCTIIWMQFLNQGMPHFCIFMSFFCVWWSLTEKRLLICCLDGKNLAASDLGATFNENGERRAWNSQHSICTWSMVT